MPQGTLSNNIPLLLAKHLCQLQQQFSNNKKVNSQDQTLFEGNFDCSRIIANSYRLQEMSLVCDYHLLITHKHALS